MSKLSREMNILGKVNAAEGKYSAFWAPKVVKALKVKGLVKVSKDDKVVITAAGLKELVV
jgi:hypothetical protein